ncbi:hypothetical protein P692DRAFT_20816052 [Suillus brevipes Sb2]|nr:hypothetical protein P692DRAFT_20816052 [Suillus brevipes Sb2]
MLPLPLSPLTSLLLPWMALPLTVTRSGALMLAKSSTLAEESRTHLMQTRPSLSHSDFDQTESPRSSTSPSLKKLCHELGLPSTGTKSVLRERLEVFSGDRELWDGLRPGAHKPHKGPRVCSMSKPKASRPKQSVQRREQLLGVTVAPSTSSTSISQSKDTRTAPEIRALLPWADAITSAYPYEPTDGMPMPASSPDPPSHSTPSVLHPSAASDAIVQDPSAAGSMPSVRPQAADIADTGAISAATTACQQPPSMVESGSSNKLRVLNLGDGTILQLVDDDIPDPPAYWPLLYRYGHNQQWKGTKSKWTDWRDVVERYRRGTPDHLWADFKTDSGEQMKFTAIVQKLRDERKAEHAALVERAHREFHAEFDDLFTYRRGGEGHVMTKLSAITRKYIELTTGLVTRSQASTLSAPVNNNYTKVMGQGDASPEPELMMDAEIHDSDVRHFAQLGFALSVKTLAKQHGFHEDAVRNVYMQLNDYAEAMEVIEEMRDAAEEQAVVAILKRKEEDVKEEEE